MKLASSTRLALALLTLHLTGLGLAAVSWSALSHLESGPRALAEARRLAQGLASGWGMPTGTSAHEPGSAPDATDEALLALGEELMPGGLCWWTSEAGAGPCFGQSQWTNALPNPPTNGLTAVGTALALASAPIDSTGQAAFVVALPVAQAAKPADAAATASFGLGLMTALASALFALFVVRRTLLRPLVPLATRLNRWLQSESRSGASALRDSSPPGDELAQLGAAVDALGMRLREFELRSERTTVEQKEALRRLSSAQQQLIHSEKLAAVGILTAGIAHEIGNPIQIALGYLDLLQSGDLTEPQRTEALGHLRDSAERVASIIHDLLAFSRPGPESAEPAMASTRQAIDQCLRLLRPQARFRQIEVSVQAPERDIWLAISPRRLEQVLVNLLLNAADAMAGKGCIEVMVVESGDGRAAIEVNDSGPGLSLAAQARLFDPFFTTKPEGKGTGLGLSVCLRIAEAFGGTLAAENRKSGGASFRLELPRA